MNNPNFFNSIKKAFVANIKPPEQTDILYRDWELLFKIADIVWSPLGEYKKILARRTEYLIKERNRKPTKCSDRETRRFKLNNQKLLDWIACAWCDLFDAWYGKRTDYSASFNPDSYRDHRE